MAKNYDTLWTGWILFAGFIMLAKGAFQILLGILAFVNNTAYVERNLLVLDYTSSGWIHIMTGALFLSGAIYVFLGRLWGRVVAAGITTVSLVTNLILLPAHPVWAASIVTLDVILLYALLVHGSDAAHDATPE